MNNQIGEGAPFDVLGYVRKYIPFGHLPFRNAQKDGLWQQLQVTFANANTDTTFKLSLGRVPSVFIQGNGTVGGHVFNGSQQGADWTSTKVVLRASIAGTYNIWVA